MDPDAYFAMPDIPLHLLLGHWGWKPHSRCVRRSAGQNSYPARHPPLRHASVVLCQTCVDGQSVRIGLLHCGQALLPFQNAPSGTGLEAAQKRCRAVLAPASGFTSLTHPEAVYLLCV